jgi:TonB-dependent SusC/RagA subfamily outer membrane receptor
MNASPDKKVISFKNMKMTIQSDDSIWTGERKPLVIINGKLIQPSTLINKTITADSAVIYSKNDMQAIRRYGKDGKNGVLLFYNAHMEDAPAKKTQELMIRSGVGLNVDTLPGEQKTGYSIMRIKGNTTEPIIIIDGEKIGRMTPEGIDALIQPTEIESIDVLKGASGVTLYGEDGKQGVILIRSKSGAWKNPRKGNNPQNENNPIVIINGIKAVGYTGGDLDQLIDPKEITTVNVLKGEVAFNKYGEDGKQGVIEIRTKEGYESRQQSRKTGKLVEVTYVQSDEGAPAFTKVDVAPSFPGGDDAMNAYIKNKLKNNSTSSSSSDKTSKGKIGLWFIVDSFGKPSAFSILSEETNNIELAKAVIEILKNGPSWEPGKQNGKQVKVVKKVYFKY